MPRLSTILALAIGIAGLAAAVGCSGPQQDTPEADVSVAVTPQSPQGATQRPVSASGRVGTCTCTCEVQAVP